jgi:hypothetical protein
MDDRTLYRDPPRPGRAPPAPLLSQRHTREWSSQSHAQQSADAWREPGQYTGYGPRDYRRPDSSVRDQIHERLTRHGYLNARDISVEVRNGEVTLMGLVDDRRSKRIAEQVAESVPGVRDVHNQLLLRNRQLISESQGMATGYGRLRNGQHVAGSDGRTIGRIKQVLDTGLIVARPVGRDLYVPDEAVQTVSETWIALNVPARDASRQGWRRP